ncbi:hypothetical protein FRB90_002135 [Tulasnella sp. 427]|nr:hypothetical protein FRB90_002135 [Tulasnella sp. 427]
MVLPLFNLKPPLSAMIPDSGSLTSAAPSTTSSPFSALPAELLSLIFLHSVAQDPRQTGLWEPVKRVRPLASITLVSRRWYQIATNTPGLWSTIIVTSHRWFPSESVDLWLHRAKRSKLDVHLLSDSPRVARIQLEVWRKILETERERVGTLNAIVGAGDWMLVKPLFPTQFPTLMSAKLHIMDVTRNDEQSELSRPSLDLPMLRHLVINSPTSLTFGSCPAMQDLEITRLGEDQNTADLGWEHLRRLLNNTPNLRTLKIRSQRPPRPPEPKFEGFDVPYLESLDLDVKGRVASVDFISHLHAPQLQHVTIKSFRAEAPPPEPFPIINLPSLHSIRLANTTLRQTIWLLNHISWMSARAERKRRITGYARV